MNRQTACREHLKTRCTGDDDIGELVPTINYSIDYDALEENGVSISQVKNELNMLSEGIPIQGIIVDGENRETTLKYSNDYSVEDVEIIKMTGEQPETFPLTDFVEETETESSKYIHHTNGDRMVELKVYADDEQLQKRRSKHSVAKCLRRAK